VTPRRTDDPRKADADVGCRPELKPLVENYGLRVRMLSEALATIGGLIAADRPVQEKILGIKRLQLQCNKAGHDLFAAVESPQTRSFAIASTGLEAPPPDLAEE
jgi:hypothetical protein